MARYVDEDESGRVVVLDEECDGVADSCETSTYDSEGRTIASERDDDCDGTLEYCTTYVVDGSSKLVQGDEGCTGTPTECEVFHFEDGWQTLRGKDIDCDGISDEECLNDRYVGGKLLGSHIDTDCDGVRDQSCMTKEATDWGYVTNIDGDLDGVTDSCWVNDDGRVTASTLDDLCDGASDAVCRTTSYDASGNKLAFQRDIGCDGAPDGVCWEWTYDSEGREISFLQDEDCDGTPEDCTFTAHH